MLLAAWHSERGGILDWSGRNSDIEIWDCDYDLRVGKEGRVVVYNGAGVLDVLSNVLDYISKNINQDVKKLFSCFRDQGAEQPVESIIAALKCCAVLHLLNSR